MIEIKVNGRHRKVLGTDMACVLDELGFDQTHVATALNGEFVPRDIRAQTRLRPGDALEVVAPMQGG